MDTNTAKNGTLTETDALAQCYAASFPCSAWGKDQATTANKHAAGLFTAGKIDADTFARVGARLGNHSASRQYLEKHGLLSVDQDALSQAIKKLVDEKRAKLLDIANVK